MSKGIGLFVKVHYDGIGDYSHFEDIYRYLIQHPKTCGYEYFVVLHASTHDPKDFEEKLMTLGVKKYFVLDNKDKGSFAYEPTLKEQLSSASQIFIISFDCFPNFENYFKSLPENIPIKYIGEHERTKPVDHGVCTAVAYSMGLSENAHGIKLQQSNVLSEQQALATIEQQAPLFHQMLLKATQTKDSGEFLKHNLLIPAYFNDRGKFFRFLLLLATNVTLPSHQDICIYFSGKSFLLKNDIECYFETSKDLYDDYPYFANSYIQSLTLINLKTGNEYVVNLNGSGGCKKIKIFYGEKINNAAYNALYKATFIAAVSGDNTFELVISSIKALPYYWSTNYRIKKATNIALATVVDNYLESTGSIDTQVKNDLQTYFEFTNFYEFANSRCSTEQDNIIKKFAQLNLQQMAVVWQDIAKHIIQKYNFYDKICDIFFQDFNNTPILTTDMTIWNKVSEKAPPADAVISNNSDQLSP